LTPGPLVQLVMG